MQIELVVRRADERLGQVHGVGDDRGHGQHVAVQHPVLGQRGHVAPRQAVAPHVPFLEVRRLDREHVAVPGASGESGPRVRRIRRRMGTAVHVDRAVHRSQPLGVPCRHLTRYRVDLLPDAQGRRAAPDVVGRMRTALPLGQRLDGRFPRRRTQPRGVADRNTKVIPELRPRHALGFVFVEPRRPFTGEVDAVRRRPPHVVVVFDKRLRL